MSTKTITNLSGHWPQWQGDIGMQFVHIRIRYGHCYIGVGNSHAEAQSKSKLFKESESLCGVTDMEDAVRMLREAGFKVETIVVPEHVETVPESWA